MASRKERVAAKSKRYRDRQKADPELLAYSQERQRIRQEARTSRRQLLTPEERRIQREKWRTQRQSHRQKSSKAERGDAQVQASRSSLRLKLKEINIEHPSPENNTNNKENCNPQHQESAVDPIESSNDINLDCFGRSYSEPLFSGRDLKHYPSFESFLSSQSSQAFHPRPPSKLLDTSRLTHQDTVSVTPQESLSESATLLSESASLPGKDQASSIPEVAGLKRLTASYDIHTASKKLCSNTYVIGSSEVNLMDTPCHIQPSSLSQTQTLSVKEQEPEVSRLKRPSPSVDIDSAPKKACLNTDIINLNSGDEGDYETSNYEPLEWDIDLEYDSFISGQTIDPISSGPRHLLHIPGLALQETQESLSESATYPGKDQACVPEVTRFKRPAMNFGNHSTPNKKLCLSIDIDLDVHGSPTSCYPMWGSSQLGESSCSLSDQAMGSSSRATLPEESLITSEDNDASVNSQIYLDVHGSPTSCYPMWDSSQLRESSCSLSDQAMGSSSRATLPEESLITSEDNDASVNSQDSSLRVSTRVKKVNEKVQRFLQTGGKRAKRPARFPPGSPVAANKKADLKKKKPVKAVCKVYNSNKKIRKENGYLRKTAEKYKKRYFRLLKSNSMNDSSSPQAEVKRLTGKRKLPKDIVRRLEDLSVIEKQMEENYKRFPGHQNKQILREVLLSGGIVKKYKRLGYMRQFGPKKSPALQRTLKPNSLVVEGKQPSETMIQEKQDVQRFLQLECNSRMTAGAKETITRNKIKKQRMYLCKPLLELFEDFKKTVTYKMSYARFCKLRPFWVLQPDVNQRETCACQTHDNMDLLLQKLHHEKVFRSRSSKFLLQDVVCDPSNELCMLRKCEKCCQNTLTLLPHDENKVINYQRWKTVTSSYEKTVKKKDGTEEKIWKKTSCPEKVTETGTVSEVLNVLSTSLRDFLKHNFFANHQFLALHNRRKTLDVGEIHIWVDFGMNWLTKYGREVQSVHWGSGRKQITLHASTSYFHNNVKKSACTVSKNRDHGPPEIMAHMIPIVKAALANQQPDQPDNQEPDLDNQQPDNRQPELEAYHISIQSDSPVMQYRGQGMFAYIAQVFPKLFPQITTLTWNYTEAGHGKGGVDGISARVKNNADNVVKHGTDVNTFEKFLAVSQKLTSVRVTEVTQEEIDVAKAMPITSIQFKGTNSVHQITWARSNPNTLFFNYLSCFLCSPGTKCSHFHLGTLVYKPLQEAAAVVSPEAVTESEPVAQPEAEPAVQHESQPVNVQQAQPSVSPKIVKNDWVAIQLSNQSYPGLVQSVRSGKVVLKIMMKSEEHYVWPPRPDCRKNIDISRVRKLDQPEKISETEYKFNI